MSRSAASTPRTLPTVTQGVEVGVGWIRRGETSGKDYVSRGSRVRTSKALRQPRPRCRPGRRQRFRRDLEPGRLSQAGPRAISGGRSLAAFYFDDRGSSECLSEWLGLPLNRDLADTSRGVPRDTVVSCGPASYDGTDWAWEFLRRNPDYGADWRSSVPRRLPHVTLKDGTRLLRLRRRFPRAERWGLYAFADPSVAARQASVFWHVAALKQVVRVRAARPTHRENLTPLTLSSFNVDRAAAIGVDGVPLLLMKGPGIHVPIEIHDVAVLTNPFAPVFEIDGFSDLSAQTELLKRLHRFTEQAPSAANRPAFVIDERLHHALIALDESLQGKTYRQIAISIFGEKKVAEEWQGPSQFLKDRTRRLVAKGTELMKGGYRDLLF